MAYVYRHIRLDKNVPFYIGIGSDDKGEYKRAHDNGLRSRNKYWNNIVAKTDYDIEIILDDLTWEDACRKEVEFIALYKRHKDGGTLANLTLGGEGQVGMTPWNFGAITPLETRKKQSIKRMGMPSPIKGTKRPQHVIDAVIKANTGRPSWNKGISPAKETIEKQLQTKKERDSVLKGEKHPMFGKTHSDELKAKWRITRKGVSPWNKGVSYPVPHLTELQKTKRQEVCQYSLDGIFLNSFTSISEASNITKAGKGNISLCCSGKRNSAGGYIWKLKEIK